jgi:FkbM family methyltransferase
MAKVFLDVGAHLGQTIEVVQDQRWAFDRIHSFEPAPACWAAITDLAGRRVELHRFGLWDRDAVVPLFNAGAVGASLSADKEVGATPVDCEFRNGAEWVRRNIAEDDEVYAKINVEGAEAELVRCLDEGGVLQRIDHLLIHFDVRKVPSKAHLEHEMRERLDRAGVQYLSADEIQYGGVYRGTRNWLQWCHSPSPLRDLRYRYVRRAEHAVRLRLYPFKMAVRRALAVQSPD